MGFGKGETDTWQTAYYIAFGAHGPRAGTPPGEGFKVFSYVIAGVAVSFALFCAIRMGAGPAPGTMNKEYQEATNEYLKVCFHFLYKRVSLLDEILAYGVEGQWSEMG